MASRLEGKVALVTGSSRGIGRAIVERLARDGATVVVHYATRDDLAQEVVRGIVDRGGRAVGLQADIAEVLQVRGLFEQAEKAAGHLDIVVANAAVTLIKPVVESTEADYDYVFNRNATGVFFVLQEAARRVRDDGRIIAVSTGGTRMYFDKLALYLGSKGAVEQFVRVLSRELGSRNVTVNTVSPGYTDTDMLPDRDRLVAAGASPFNRIGAPDDVADAVALLASDDARWVTGQNLAAGGGVF
jgi:3-oxoacyl-[acyl-carrier protein] reductase